LSPWYETSLRKVYAPNADFHPRPGWVIVDVGANIGAYSVWAAAQLGSVGKLVAIEPNPVSYKQLERSIGRLRVDATAVQAACGDAEGEVILHFEPGYTVSSSITEFAAATESVRVHMRRLDDIMRENAVEHVDVLKIDVEGAEEMVLRGAGDTLRDIDRVVVETTEGDVGSAVRALLQSRNFALVHEEREHWSIPGLELLAFRRVPPT
jgi:FkbM family methyltransferase